MQYRSVRSLREACCRFLAAALISTLPYISFATVDLDPVNAGSTPELDTETDFHYAGSGDDTVQGTFNSTTRTFTADSTVGFVNTDTTFFDLRMSAADTASGTETGFSNAVVLDVFSDTPPASSSGYVVIIAEVEDENGDRFLVPIAAHGSTNDDPANLTACDSSSSCYFDDTDPDGTDTDLDDSDFSTEGFRFGVAYSSGSTVRIALYPKDICIAYLAQKGDTDSIDCDSSNGNSAIDNALAVMTEPTSSGSTDLEIRISVRATANQTEIYAQDGTSDDTSNDHTINFYRTPPTVTSCTDESIYFPGDTEIMVDPEKIAASKQTGGADVTEISVIATKGGVTTTSPFGSTVVGFGEYSTDDQTITGFENLTRDDTTSNLYDVAFSVRDEAGIVAEFIGTTANESCYVANVGTSGINGLLESGNCFIGTAAFGDLNHRNLDLYRAFRDRVLKNFALGRAFVEWYYEWSPKAAHELKDFPVLRYATLVFLMPFQIVAWLTIYPQWGLIVLTLLMVALGGLVWKQVRPSFEKEDRGAVK